MKTKIIFSALALAMLLATACNKNESAIEESNEKGYALPVTINVTRKGDAPATRATFNDGTKKLSFTPGRFCYPFLGVHLRRHRLPCGLQECRLPMNKSYCIHTDSVTFVGVKNNEFWGQCQK